MAIVVVCGLLLLGGLTAIVGWGGLGVEAPALPAADGPRPVLVVIRRYVWTISLLLWTTILAALLVVGPAARLAMRLLAMTAGAEAQGLRTEADEIVGRITSGGTIGIFVFIGLFAGFLSALSFVVLRRWLPRGRWGGLILGVLILVIAGSRIEPLRPDNPDFDLVGPGWLSIVVFSAMVLVTGMAVQAIAGRVSRSLPLPGPRVRELLPHAVLVFFVPGFVLAGGAILAGAVVVALSRTHIMELFQSRWVSIAGYVVVGAAAVVGLPGFVSAIVDIAGRGP